MSFPQGIAFRQNGGFVTDGASDFCCDYVSAYPTTSTQGNTVGWEAGASSARDRSATIPRLAGKVGIDAPTIATFRIDLPATGNYNVYLAAGEAAYSAETKTELFDTTSSLGVLESGSTGAANSFKDAANNTRTAANWVSTSAGGGTAFAATFSTTICRFKAGDGVLNCSISYFYIEAAGGGGSTGTVAKTNANDTSAASGTTTILGTLAKTNANDTLSASGTTTVTGTLAKTNANDSVVASGTTTVTGALAKTNSNDTVVASGAAGNITGTLAYTNRNDTASALGIAGIIQAGGGGKKKKRRVIKYSDFAHQEEREMAFRAAIGFVPMPGQFDAYDDEEDDDEILLMTLARLFH